MDEHTKCPVEITVEVAGGKWKPMILYRLFGGPRRFGELRRLTGDPSQRSLTMQLRQLEADGIVHRKVFAEVPPRVEYSLTEFGRTLAPVLMAMRDWGVSFTRHHVGTPNAPNAPDALDGACAAIDADAMPQAARAAVPGRP